MGEQLAYHRSSPASCRITVTVRCVARPRVFHLLEYAIRNRERVVTNIIFWP
jgi:hypothetical protein